MAPWPPVPPPLDRGKAVKQVDNFRYLGSLIHAQGGSEEDIKARIAAA